MCPSFCLSVRHSKDLLMGTTLWSHLLQNSWTDISTRTNQLREQCHDILWSWNTLVMKYFGHEILWSWNTLVMKYLGHEIPWSWNTLVMKYFGHEILWSWNTLIIFLNVFADTILWSLLFQNGSAYVSFICYQSNKGRM